MRMVCSSAPMTADRLSRAVRAGEVEDETAAAGHAFCYAGLHGAGRVLCQDYPTTMHSTVGANRSA